MKRDKTKPDKKVKVTIRLPESMVKAGKIHAVQVDEDFQDVVNMALMAYLKQWTTAKPTALWGSPKKMVGEE